MNEGMPTSNVMKDEFGWEVPVESVPLPSRGVIYSPDSLIYNTETLQIKAMTAREEDILSSQAYIKENSVVENLIVSCLMEKSIDVNDLIIGDRNALMVSIRITGYGTDYKIKHSCESCSHSNEVVVDLSKLGIKRLVEEPLAPGKNIFQYQLPVTKKNIHYKFLNGHNQKEIACLTQRCIGYQFVIEDGIFADLRNILMIKIKHTKSQKIKTVVLVDKKIH